MPASSVSVTYPTAGVGEGDPTELQVVLEEYRHDIATFVVPRNTPKPYHRAGTPVVISWTHERATATFYGYVEQVEPRAGSGSQRIWCRGASAVLDNGLQAVYRYRTVPSFISEVARSTNFDAEIIEHGQVFDTLQAPGGRLWDVLVEYAKEIGYSFYCHNTRMMLHPRLHQVERHVSVAPVLREGENLSDFVPQDGQAPVGTRRVERALSGYDPYTGGRFTVVGGVARSRMGREMALPAGRHYLPTEARTPEEARWKLAAMAENDRFNLTARATATGDANLIQTWPVILDGVGDRYVGAWFVRKVTHKPMDPTYTMDLELGRDATGSDLEIPDPRAKRVLATRNNPQGRPKVVYPASVLAGAQWRSQWSAAARTFVEPSKRVMR